MSQRDPFGDLRDSARKNRGALGCLGVLLVLAVIGGVSAATQQYLGGQAPWAGVAVAAVLVLIGFGLVKGARWAQVSGGLVALLGGLAFTAFLAYDFWLSVTQGHSYLHTSAISASNYGQSLFILTFIAAGLVFAGVFMMFWPKFKGRL